MPTYMVGFNFQWVDRSTEWIDCGLPGLSLKPPLNIIDIVLLNGAQHLCILLLVLR